MGHRCFLQGSRTGGESMDHAHNRKNRILLAIITMIVIYIAVSVYGVIRVMATTSTMFTISSGLPPIESVERATPFLEKIKNYFSPPAKRIVPAEKRVTIKGKVIYTNGNPFAKGLVDLRSEPRFTYTDLEGYFIFENVEDGEHTVSVLDQNRNVLASCRVIVNRNI
ncbi:MAG: carboxypeptidase-like regulatory domain-containing protein, partial [Desulfitobacteriaceae bacterium]|nr:carboxypeptidase-like regulatory domain-containing protein [Desulfitobacteriaceae bacterium]